jgi:hypothetical protein
LCEGEGGSNEPAAAKFPEKFKKRGCLLKQMFKFNETGMFCKLCSIYVILSSSTFFFVTQAKKNSKHSHNMPVKAQV